MSGGVVEDPGMAGDDRSAREWGTEWGCWGMSLIGWERWRMAGGQPGTPRLQISTPFPVLPAAFNNSACECLDQARLWPGHSSLVSLGNFGVGSFSGREIGGPGLSSSW